MADNKNKDDIDGRKSKFKQMPSICVKTCAESIGYSNLSDNCVQSISEAVTFYLRDIIQDSLKFRDHRKGSRLSCSDIDNTLKSKNVEPLYGVAASDYIPFRFTSGGGREFHITEETEVDLKDMMTNNLPKIHHDIALKAHWLAIEGVQPNIPENPPPTPLFQLNVLNGHHGNEPRQTSMPLKSCRVPDNNPLLTSSKVPTTGNSVQLKDRFTHELSVEQQLYYKEITEAAVGANESRRAEALSSLVKDPGLSQMLPRFSTFIAEGVRVNVAQNNLALLIYLMRMVKALMDNPSLNLEKYLHELNPAVMTCIVSRQLCSRPDHDNHWALRDYAARLMSQICRGFNTTTNQIQPRVLAIFCKSLHDDKSSLSTRYGCLAGLAELGAEVIQKFILVRLRSEGERIKSVLDSQSPNPVDKAAAERIRILLVKHCSTLIKNLLQPPDKPEDYQQRYGCLGFYVCQQVTKIREQEAHKSRLYASTGLPTRHNTNPVCDNSLLDACL